MNKSTIIKSVAAVGISLGAMSLAGCASCDRWNKSMESDLSGGLDRTITLYDYNGDEITHWEGQADVEFGSEGNGRVIFDMDGKRTQIVGGIVVVQEK